MIEWKRYEKLRQESKLETFCIGSCFSLSCAVLSKTGPSAVVAY